MDMLLRWGGVARYIATRNDFMIIVPALHNTRTVRVVHLPERNEYVILGNIEPNKNIGIEYRDGKISTEADGGYEGIGGTSRTPECIGG